MRSPRARGAWLLVLSGVAFGSLGVFGKSAFAHGVAPTELLALRFALAALLLTAVLALARRRGLAWAQGLSTPQRLAGWLLGAVGYAVFSGCFFTALDGLSASLAVLLFFTYPVFVMLGARLWLGERMGVGAGVLPLALLGMALLVWGDVEVREPTAIGFALTSSAVYAGYILASRRWLAQAPAMASAAAIQTGAACVLLLTFVTSPERIAQVWAVAWPEITALALVCTILAIGLFLAGLRHVQAWEASILSASEPLVGVLLGVLVLGDQLSLLQAVGGALVLVAMFWVAMVGRRAGA